MLQWEGNVNGDVNVNVPTAADHHSSSSPSSYAISQYPNGVSLNSQKKLADATPTLCHFYYSATSHAALVSTLTSKSVPILQARES
ncbi:hypothetical protein V502_07831, partial [Pseudogymnoascus sp. VKM F-4520 (FW-2644)]